MNVRNIYKNNRDRNIYYNNKGDNKVMQKTDEMTHTHTHYKHYLLENGKERIATCEEFNKVINSKSVVSIENKFEKMFFEKKGKKYIGRVYMY